MSILASIRISLTSNHISNTLRAQHLSTSLISNRTSTLPLLRSSLLSPTTGLSHNARRTISTRSFVSTSNRSDFHFDTHHFVQRLEREGLKREQAEGIMTAMAEVIDEAIRNMTSNMVTKAEQEKHQYTQKIDFAQSKSELQLMAKNDLAMIKAENERLVTEVERLKQRLRVEITRTQAGVRLDLNLEKGRIREESSKQELKIKEVDTRIEQEIANLKTSIQASKATTLQYLVGFVTGCSALLMAYLRFRV